MKKITPAAAIAVTLLVPSLATADLVYGFKNPSFNGNGYSTHVLSTEQLQYKRKKDREVEARAEEERLKRELENSTLNKFLKNVESRIYATLSKQMVDAMFADCTENCATSGTAEVEGSQIYWVKDTSTDIITLTITDPTGTVSSLTVPVGDFIF